jgi:DNA-dependent protein kinase catalytic subunit
MNKTNLNNLSTFEKEIDLNLQYDKLNCFFLYKKFIKEIYVRMKQFKDELLASCLEFMLSLPKELIVLNLKEVFEALQVIYETIMTISI